LVAGSLRAEDLVERAGQRDRLRAIAARIDQHDAVPEVAPIDPFWQAAVTAGCSAAPRLTLNSSYQDAEL